MLNLSGYVVLGLMIISPNLGGGNNQDDFMRLSPSWSYSQQGLLVRQAASQKEQQTQRLEQCHVLIVFNLIFVTIIIFSRAPVLQMMYFLLRKGSSNKIIKDQ